MQFPFPFHSFMSHNWWITCFPPCECEHKEWEPLSCSVAFREFSNIPHSLLCTGLQYRGSKMYIGFQSRKCKLKKSQQLWLRAQHVRPGRYNHIPKTDVITRITLWNTLLEHANMRTTLLPVCWWKIAAWPILWLIHYFHSLFSLKVC